MKILNAIGSAEIVRLVYEKTGTKLNYMISYNYLKGQVRKLTKEYRHMSNLLYLDSGAYSVYTGKTKISVSEYSLWINRYGNLWDEVFNLDEDFSDPELNLTNQLFLVKNLPPGRKKPIPVVHSPDNPFEELKTYVGLGYDYIAIGSTMKSKDKLFNQIEKEYPDLKIHLFGDLNRKTLMNHKPYSADSSTFAQAAARGIILYWREEEQREYGLDLGERDRKTDEKPGKDGSKIVQLKDFKYRKEFKEFLSKTFQYKPRDLIHSSDAKWVVNCFFMKQLEDHINGLSV